MIEEVIGHRIAVRREGYPVFALWVVPEQPKSGIVVEVQTSEGNIATFLSRDDARQVAQWIQARLLLP